MADEKRIRELVEQLGTRLFLSLDTTRELVIIGKPAVPALINALKNRTPLMRFNAAWTLGDIGRTTRLFGGVGDSGVVPALIEALEDEDSLVRYSVARSLSYFDDSSVVSKLVEALKDKNSDVRKEALASLRSILIRCETIESLEAYEKGLDEGLARLQKKYRDDDLVEVGFKIARWKKDIAAKKNDLASHRDLILEDIPKPPPKKKGRIYQELGRIRNG